MNDKIRKYVIPFLPYVFIGVLLGNIGEAYRMVAGADMGRKIVGMVATVGPAFANVMPGPYLSDWLIGFAGAALLWLVVWNKSKRAKKFRRDAEYGTARWGAYYQRKTKFY